MPYLKEALLCLDCSWINENFNPPPFVKGEVTVFTNCQKCTSINLFNMSIWLDKKEKEKESANNRTI